jgi:hypothetical protein
VLNRLDLVAEEDRAECGLGIAREDLQRLAAHAKRAARQRLVVAVVLHVDELAQDLVAIGHVPAAQGQRMVAVLLWRAQAVDARDGGDDDHVAAREQRGGGRVPQAVDLVVDRAVLLDVEVLRRYVGLGLVVVVVGDEVLDRVLREELAELVAELSRQRLVVGDHQRGPLDLLDRERHRRGLARAGDAEQRLEAVVPVQPGDEAIASLGLIRYRGICGVDLERRHATKASPAKVGTAKVR